jgi:hypothetical protein
MTLVAHPANRIAVEHAAISHRIDREALMRTLQDGSCIGRD